MKQLILGASTDQGIHSYEVCNSRSCDAMIHQTFQIAKNGGIQKPIEAVWILLMDTGKPTPKIAGYEVQETLHFRYLKFLVNDVATKSLFSMSTIYVFPGSPVIKQILPLSAGGRGNP